MRLKSEDRGCEFSASPSERHPLLLLLQDDLSNSQIMHKGWPIPTVAATPAAAVMKPAKVAAHTSTNADPFNPNESVGELDLTGSPLEAPFTLDQEESFADEPEIVVAVASKVALPKPFTIHEARQMLGDQVRGGSLKDVTNYIVTDGKDGESTYILGVGNREGITLRSSVTTNTDLIPKTKLPTYTTMYNNHMKMKPKSKRNTQVANHVRCVYPVFKSTESVSGVQAEVTLSCDWKDCKQTLQLAPLYANTVANIVAVGSMSASPLHSLYEELVTLSSLHTAISAHYVEWRSKLQGDKLTQALHQLLTTNHVHINQKKTTIDPTNQQRSYNQRADQDFIGQLWLLLKDCGSYEELTSSLQTVLTSLASGNVRPQIYPDNKCELSRLALQLCTGAASPPVLSGKTPLQLLVGAGIQKLKRDYLYLYISNGLATLDQLSPYFQSSSFSTSVEVMHRLHYTLEAGVLAHLYLALPADVLGSNVRRVLKSCSVATTTTHYTAQFTLQPTDIRDKLEKCSASSWRIGLSSKSRDYIQEDVYLFTTEKPAVCPDDICIDPEVEAEVDEELGYYLTHMTTLGDNLF